MKVWVTGAAGLLGSEVAATLRAAGEAVTATDREVDITRADAVRRQLDACGPPDWMVNCAAWTAVDDAETNAAAAFSLNEQGPRVLAEEAVARGFRLVHISTDYVFDGRASRPYRPDDPPAPCGVYGRSKWAGEEAIRRTLPGAHVILRTAWLYGVAGKNFVNTMLRLMRSRTDVRVVADQRGSPTWARDLAQAVAGIISARISRSGTWHAAGAGQTTWFGFAQAIHEIGRAAGLLDADVTLTPVSTADYPTPAVRPAYSLLDTATLACDWGLAMPPWRESLEHYLHTLAEHA